MRNFQTDFVLPSIKELTPAQIDRVALALDIAITYGVLEYASGNRSLQDLQGVDLLYQEKVARLKAL